MDFTFGIITDGKRDHFVEEMVSSIERLKISNYEILIVGNSNVSGKNTTVIPFDENERPNWITRKRNIVTENAKHENIAYSHDYYVFNEDWYDGYLRYGDNFKVCLNRVLNKRNERYMDWLIWPFNRSPMDKIVSSGLQTEIEKDHANRECLIPYDITHLSKYMYVNASYFVAKKSIMKRFPFDENKVWGMGDDVEWSMRYRSYPGNTFSINSRSTNIILKDKKSPFKECSPDTVEKLISFI